MPTPLNRRQFGTLIAGTAAAAATVATTPTWAQVGGSTVNLVVPFAPGGPTDAMARVLAAALHTSMKQTVVVNNRPGAGGNIGADYVAHAEPNGNTLLFGTSGPLAINITLYSKLNYDPIKSFAPVMLLGRLPNVLVVNPTIPAKNVQELVTYAKAHPGKLSFASSGNGASSHLAGVLFNDRCGTDIQHVPYKGTGPALNDLLGGQVSMAFTDVLTALPHIKSGRLRVLGVTSATRSRSLPDVPTLQEQGIKDFDVSVFFAVVAPAGTPAETIQRLNHALVDAVQNKEVRQQLETQGVELSTQTSPEALGQFLRKEVALWHDLVKLSGAHVD